MRRQDQAPRWSKHHPPTGHTRRAPPVETRHTGPPVAKASTGTKSNKLYETNHPAYGPTATHNRKQGHHSDCRICETTTPNEIHHNLATSTYLQVVRLAPKSPHTQNMLPRIESTGRHLMEHLMIGRHIC
jgi:hypothetical protein